MGLVVMLEIQMETVAKIAVEIQVQPSRQGKPRQCFHKCSSITAEVIQVQLQVQRLVPTMLPDSNRQLQNHQITSM